MRCFHEFLFKWGLRIVNFAVFLQCAQYVYDLFREIEWNNCMHRRITLVVCVNENLATVIPLSEISWKLLLLKKAIIVALIHVPLVVLFSRKYWRTLYEMVNQMKVHLGTFPILCTSTLVTNSKMVDYLTSCSKAFCNVTEADIHAFFSCTLPTIQIDSNESFTHANTLYRFIHKHPFPVNMYFVEPSKASSSYIRPPRAEKIPWPLISNQKSIKC